MQIRIWASASQAGTIHTVYCRCVGAELKAVCVLYRANTQRSFRGIFSQNDINNLMPGLRRVPSIDCVCSVSTINHFCMLHIALTKKINNKPQFVGAWHLVLEPHSDIIFEKQTNLLPPDNSSIIVCSTNICSCFGLGNICFIAVSKYSWKWTLDFRLCPITLLAVFCYYTKYKDRFTFYVVWSQCVFTVSVWFVFGLHSTRLGVCFLHSNRCCHLIYKHK